MAGNKPLTERELDFLHVVFEYSRKNQGKPPNNQWLSKKLHISEAGIVNIKKKLKGKKLLDDQYSLSVLTENAKEQLRKLLVVDPTEIVVLGQVKAGKVANDTLVSIHVDLRNLSFAEEMGLEKITIPGVEDASTIFALEVVGRSMEAENIFEGDYVIVQTYKDSKKPKQGELLVVEYLPIKEESHVQPEQLYSGIGIPNDFLEGPTVKYYYEQEDCYRLSHRKGHQSSEFTIKALYVHPIGRVIGVYRQYQ